MRNLTLIIAALIFSVAGTNLYGQTPCINGMAGDYPCMEYDLMSVMTLDDLNIVQNGNDCWGWTDPETGIEYVIMGGRNRTVFLDITDPVNPVIMGHLQTATSPSLWRDIKVFNDHAFIVSEANGHGMQVFDLTRLRDLETIPTTFDADAYFDDFGHAHNIAINEQTGYAYAIGTSNFGGGPHFVNIQDPLNPFSEGGYDGDGYSHDAQIVVYQGPDTDHFGKEVYFGFNENSLTIVDVTHKDDPILISRTEYEQSAYTHQGWLDESHTTVYMNDEIDETTFDFNTRTLIMDVTDLDMPSLTHEHFGLSPAIDHNLYVRGDKLFQSNYTSGLRVMQISDDPDNLLEEIGYFDCYPNDDNPVYQGTWSNYPYFASGNIVISAFDGMYIVNSSTITFSGVDEVSESTFEIFPNPASDLLRIEPVEGERIERFVISDISGRVMMSNENVQNNENRLQIDISALSPGAYLITLNDNTNSQKFIVK